MVHVLQSKILQERTLGLSSNVSALAHTLRSINAGYTDNGHFHLIVVLAERCLAFDMGVSQFNVIPSVGHCLSYAFPFKSWVARCHPLPVMFQCGCDHYPICLFKAAVN